MNGGMEVPRCGQWGIGVRTLLQVRCVNAHRKNEAL